MKKIVIGAMILLFSSCGMAQTLCSQYQSVIKRSAYRTFGPSAPVATLVAQLHQESACRSDVSSRAGAQGLSQFMPATAEDMARLHPDVCAPANPFSASWAIMCRDRYMRDLLRQVRSASSESDQWAFALSAYNGGMGWVRRDQEVCRYTHGCDPDVYWNSVENVFDRRRSKANIKENRHYPYRIMCELAPRYTSWGRLVECP